MRIARESSESHKSKSANLTRILSIFLDSPPQKHESKGESSESNRANPTFPRAFYKTFPPANES